MELAGSKVGHVIKNDIDLRVVNGYFKQAIPTHVLTCHIRTGIKRIRINIVNVAQNTESTTAMCSYYSYS